MADPVSNAEIEDVLSSIRRLVSEEPSGTKRRPTSEELNDRLVLTPAHRVAGREEAPEADQSEVANPTPEPAAEAPKFADQTADSTAHRQRWEPEAGDEPDLSEIAKLDSPDSDKLDDESTDEADVDSAVSQEQAKGSLETRVAEIEAALFQSDDEWEPDGSEDGLSDETRPLSLDANFDMAEAWKREAEADAADDASEEQAAASEMGESDPAETEANSDEVADMSLLKLPESDSMQEQATEIVDIDAPETGADVHETEDALAESETEPDLAEHFDDSESPEAAADAQESDADETLEKPGVVAQTEEAAEEDLTETLTLESAVEDPGALDWEEWEPEEDKPGRVAAVGLESVANDLIPDADEVEDSDATAEVTDDPIGAGPEAAVEDDEEGDAFSLYGDEALLDEDALRDMVAEMVREELQGELGERITRNVRRLVRREIERALAMRDLG
ncbi:hypothetical protein [Pseudoruegeria sp. HB172150]|uniref:hypothetical protein n=1 Tax=Pseudoruegeria sp. HB172150 TaxID=2721164 RepID=UPI0015516BE9|nr:hypothetical protein [Pseudoruegeria sp. HB172150]